MARHCERDPTLIYQAAELFRNRCLLADGSLLLPDQQLWTAQNLDTLHRVFVNAPDTSERDFESKFRDQIVPAGPDVVRLAAEVIAVYFLFPSNVGGARKRELVNEVLGWNGESMADDHLVSQAFEIGIGSGGLGFNTQRRYALYYVIEFVKSWRALPSADQTAYLADPWKMLEFSEGVEGAEGAQMRHVLLHLLFPDHFERIASGGHKRRIRTIFGELAGQGAEKEPLDRQLYLVRQKLEELMPGEALDFYWEPLQEAWYGDGEESGVAVSLEAVRYKKQLVLYGPPGTGKTHQAKALAEQLIRGAALHQWGAPAYFAGEAKIQEAMRNNVRRLQLHPAYSYEDFIRGLQLVEGGRTEYRLGYLPGLIDRMNEDDPKVRLPYVLILDEINRTDLSRLLGECFSLLENRDEVVELPGAWKDGKPMQLSLPSDLYVIGTMNLIDQSIEQIDFALRRRFLWVECPFSARDLLHICQQRWEALDPPYHGWDRVAEEFTRLAAAAKALNAAICESPLLGSQYEIGHTYFLDAVHFLEAEVQGYTRLRKHLLWKGEMPNTPLTDLWELALKPLVREYLSGLDAPTRHSELDRLAQIFFTRPGPIEGIL